VVAPAEQNQGPWRSKSAAASPTMSVRCAAGKGTISNGAAVDELLMGATNVAHSGSIQALLAEITPVADEKFSGNHQCDANSPSAGFSSISEAVEAIRQGKFVVVVDDEDRENEGDLIMPADMMTPEAMAFLVQHSTGIVCVGMKGEMLDRLQIPLMVPDKDNEEALLTAFTVTVDVKAGTSTGVSAKDRCLTVRALASSDSRPNHFRRPGHIFPLRYREGGVLKRAGHTEAAVDLAVMAGFAPAGVLCELINKDGSMSRLPELKEFAKAHNLPLISIADLIR
jgi:3,4-dihydroxy 2-butanone 4-phosphate synthase/GTP cyclohydrolase II